MGMSHRGRLNVIVQVAKRPAEEVFAGFEDVDPRSVLGSGDVKYHMGATGNYETRSGAKIHIHLVSNPSHWKRSIRSRWAVRGQSMTAPEKTGAQKYLPLLIHGDGAFAGQGVTAETLNYADLPAYSVGGTIHIIVNNLIGFTTVPGELHSSRFAAQIARRQAIPIFHVNAEDVDAVLRVGRMALEYRYTFGSDVVIDLIGYRRHGHSEVDDPTVTQPLIYKALKEHPPLYEIYAEDIGADDVDARVQAIRGELEEAQTKAKTLKSKPLMRTCLPTGIATSVDDIKPNMQSILASTPRNWPSSGQNSRVILTDFHIHPKVKKLLEQRGEMGQGKRAVDYGMAEALAFGQPGEERHPSAHERAGLPARHLQSTPLSLARHRERAGVRPAAAYLARPGALRNLQFDAF